LHLFITKVENLVLAEMEGSSKIHAQFCVEGLLQEKVGVPPLTIIKARRYISWDPSVQPEIAVRTFRASSPVSSIIVNDKYIVAGHASGSVVVQQNTLFDISVRQFGRNLPTIVQLLARSSIQILRSERYIQ
jgi:hypothetical protein